MGYFDERKNVDAYIQMAEGYDGRELITILKKRLPAGSTVLELGMGPGIDLDLLAESYTVRLTAFTQTRCCTIWRNRSFVVPLPVKRNCSQPAGC
jgi:cyclopropane fatty-acyl-phospholipid synthase-like methyltransferase